MNTTKHYDEHIHLHQDGHPLTRELTGKAVRLRYQSGHVLEQHWQTDSQILWKGVEGTLTGYYQYENYRMMKITEGIYFITWMEDSTVATPESDLVFGPWLTDVVLDFNQMIATASWVGPASGQSKAEYILDQAEMSYIECDLTEAN